MLQFLVCALYLVLPQHIWGVVANMIVDFDDHEVHLLTVLPAVFYGTLYLSILMFIFYTIEFIFECDIYYYYFMLVYFAPVFTYNLYRTMKAISKRNES